jgi:hypothetical protein
VIPHKLGEPRGGAAGTSRQRYWDPSGLGLPGVAIAMAILLLWLPGC